MTTQQFPKNRVTLYGVIDQRVDRADKKKHSEPAIRRFRNPAGGADYSISLQVAAPYGGSYKIEVDVGHVAGTELLAGCKAGQGVVLTGYLTRSRTVDRRFRDYEEELIEGVVYRDLQIEVESLRTRSDGDPQGTGSNVAIEGTVVEPPFFIRHPEHPEIELARVVLKTRTQPLVDDTGCIVPAMPCEVTVVMPSDDEATGLLYRRGNVVRVRGVLERLAMRQAGRTLVRERLEALKHDFEEARSALKAQEGDTSRVLNTTGDRYIRDRDRFSRVAHTLVLAVDVTPLGGATPCSREEAREDRLAFVREQAEAWKARRAEQRERRKQNRAHGVAARAEEDQTATRTPEDDALATAADGAADDAPKPLVHRRRKPQIAEIRDGVDHSTPDTELVEVGPVEAGRSNGVLVEG